MPRPAFHLGYRPDLDGLRGVAILMVVLDHAFPRHGDSFGSIGVDIFFVLSGFLITTLLVEEWQQAGKISLRAFYARRALRLLPGLIAMLAAFVAYGAIAHGHRKFLLDLRDAFMALFYSMNWACAWEWITDSLLGHTWSLSLEEQFYLLWPAIFVLLLRRAKRVSLPNYILLGAFFSCLLRFLLTVSANTLASRMYCGLDTRGDALLLGCALGVALGFGMLPDSPRRAAWLRWTWLPAFGIYGFIGSQFIFYGPGMYCFGWLLVSLLAVMILLTLMTVPGTALQGLLEMPALVYLGRISYSLYLWHYPVISAVREQVDWPPARQAAVFVPLTIGLSLASYYLVERPCLRLKKRFQKVA